MLCLTSSVKDYKLHLPFLIVHNINYLIYFGYKVHFPLTFLLIVSSSSSYPISCLKAGSGWGKVTDNPYPYSLHMED